jgi:hypothetical protein
MIYTFGCSATKWYWPTWADWARVYLGPVTNLGFKGYGNQNIYWNLVAYRERITKDDTVYILWTQNHRIALWYDREWIDDKDCLGFFPNTQGQLWFTAGTPYMGLYRTHPEHQTSFANIIIDKLKTIYDTQLVLDTIGCKYLMHFAQNPWFDARPSYKPVFTPKWDTKSSLLASEAEYARKILAMPPIAALMKSIDWTKFSDPPADPFDPDQYLGFMEYYLRKKEFVIYSHESDRHPVALAQHDLLFEKFLKQDAKTARHRSAAIEISKAAMYMPIPKFTEQDFVAPAETETLDPKFQSWLDQLK